VTDSNNPDGQEFDELDQLLEDSADLNFDTNPDEPIPDPTDPLASVAAWDAEIARRQKAAEESGDEMDPFTKARLAELHSFNEATRILLDERIARREVLAQEHAEQLRAERQPIDFGTLSSEAFAAVLHGATTGELLPEQPTSTQINTMIAAVSPRDEEDF
jgi:hypothetical protein